ncbi:MAG: hypothetical protein J0L56_09850 [Chitinophagales bacterium]|nr:hypothetical protein [Chitinophagales bacterium]
MKISSAAILFVLIILFSCQKKAMPVITARTIEPSAPKTEELSVPDLPAGKQIFTNRCGRCHGLPDPVQYTAKRWEAIMALMAPKAKLSKQEQVHVTAWVKENAAK